MPAFLEEKLKKEYGNNKHAIYGTLNKLGYMKGNKETKKGEKADKKHEAKSRALKKVKNLENAREKGSKTIDIIRKNS